MVNEVPRSNEVRNRNRTRRQYFNPNLSLRVIDDSTMNVLDAESDLILLVVFGLLMCPFEELVVCIKQELLFSLR